MLHLLGKGQAPEWNEECMMWREVFALLCYRGIHYAKWVCIDVIDGKHSWFVNNPRKGSDPPFFV